MERRASTRRRCRSSSRPSGPAATARGRPVALGLDVTERAKFTPDHLTRLARAPAAARRFAARRRGRRPFGPEPRSVASDPSSGSSTTRCASTWSSTAVTTASTARSSTIALAVAAALDPSLVRTEALTVDVELGGTLTTGETVTDWRRVWGRPPNVDVGGRGGRRPFLDAFIERVGGLAARRLATWQAERRDGRGDRPAGGDAHGLALAAVHARA